MIFLDTNFLVHLLVPSSKEAILVEEWFNAGETVAINLIVWAEFLCGPVTTTQEKAARNLFPDPELFDKSDAEKSAELFNLAGRRRGSMPDCMIAATCLREGASLATQNADDFRRFVPAGLKLIDY